MMKEEFERLLETGTGEKETLSQADWEIVNKVYTWHPMFDDCPDPKGLACELYRWGKMTSFKDMLSRVENIDNCDAQIKAKQKLIDGIQEDIAIIASRRSKYWQGIEEVPDCD